MSMVFKIMASSSTFHAVDYNDKKLGKGGAELVHLENFGHLQLGNNPISKLDLKKYLEDYSSRNKRVQKAQFHAMLSCKGNVMTHEQLRDNALEIMAKMGYEGNPILIYSHSDTVNNHVHIVTSRIDQNGKKIKDNFEKKQSNMILNEILKQDPKRNFKLDLETAIAYNFSSVPQFLMLFENKGYSIKEKGNEIAFFKHGALQGTTEKSMVADRITSNSVRSKKTHQIRAIINKYAQNYSSELKQNANVNYSSAKPRYESELTRHLKENFGYEFMFFTGKDKDNPYGYAMVDHHNSTIYKGSELIKLGELLAIKAASPEQIKSPIVNLDSVGQPIIMADDISNKVDSNPQSKEESIFSSISVPNILGLLASNNNSIQSSAGLTQVRKKKRKNNFY